jgi:hypothetical protein
MEITNWVVSPIFENLFFNLSIYNSEELFVEHRRCADVKKCRVDIKVTNFLLSLNAVKTLKKRCLEEGVGVDIFGKYFRTPYCRHYKILW